MRRKSRISIGVPLVPHRMVGRKRILKFMERPMFLLSTRFPYATFSIVPLSYY